jgi:hypothetical protein
MSMCLDDRGLPSQSTPVPAGALEPNREGTFRLLCLDLAAFLLEAIRPVDLAPDAGRVIFDDALPPDRRPPIVDRHLDRYGPASEIGEGCEMVDLERVSRRVGAAQPRVDVATFERLLPSVHRRTDLLQRTWLRRCVIHEAVPIW